MGIGRALAFVVTLNMNDVKEKYFKKHKVQCLVFSFCKYIFINISVNKNWEKKKKHLSITYKNSRKLGPKLCSLYM